MTSHTYPSWLDNKQKNYYLGWFFFSASFLYFSYWSFFVRFADWFCPSTIFLICLRIQRKWWKHEVWIARSYSVEKVRPKIVTTVRIKNGQVFKLLIENWEKVGNTYAFCVVKKSIENLNHFRVTHILIWKCLVKEKAVE